jgi:hypothetical protein
MDSLPTPFNFALETVLQKVRNENTGAYLGNKKFKIITYAEDTVLGQKDDIRQMFTVLINETKMKGQNEFQ